MIFIIIIAIVIVSSSQSVIIAMYITIEVVATKFANNWAQTENEVRLYEIASVMHVDAVLIWCDRPCMCIFSSLKSLMHHAK